eukprot:CAMPEP_0119301548 /NCGR_PEP_ID=MMETSP1333-20130426/3319_1 /TAXON_ID=418940 /ORGANISM="Scyphosphaera apsteinii, Strain RCC1455" /LENGTH=457 /DNA_ID=CAMNT_0007303661 /DNA_START=73 /DNA_END=1446 /DNA_ORIENTATION=-
MSAACVTRAALLSALSLVSARLLRTGENVSVASTLEVLPCAAPTRRAPVSFPLDITRGLAPPIDFEMESGYINVTSSDYLFYWYMGPRAGTPVWRDAPVLVWSNGGPGCSAMEGATTEGGALWLFNAKQSGKTAFAGDLSRNPYAWNQQAHLVFVDQPRYVGYSTGTGKRISSSAAAGLDMVQFLLGWRRTFPEHAHRNIILASESYGGHYVPAWAAAVLDHNQLHSNDKLPVTALMIGNGIVNGSVQSGSFTAFAHAQQLIPKSAHPASDAAARRLVRQTLGYAPNFYDYRLRDVECCGCTSYDYKEWSEWFLRPDVKKALNVCGDAGKEAFGGCAAGCVDLPGFDLFDTFSYSGSLSRALQTGWRVTFYYGKQDTACNYVGALAMANDSLTWSGAREWAQTPFEPLVVGGAVVGEVRARKEPNGAKLTFMAVDGAGHMVPMDNGAAASFALATLG